MSADIMENRFAAGQVTDLEVTAGGAKLTVLEAADNEICVMAENLLDGSYTCKLRGSRLVVSYELRGVRRLRGSNWDKTQIVVYLPAGSSFDNIVLSIGAGQMCMDAVPISCKRMQAEIGAGKWKAERLSVSGRLSIETGAGKVRIREAKAGSLEISCGAGGCAYEGRVDGDINVSCSVGSCELCLENAESDFNYDISCALGEVSVNDSKVSCIGTQSRSTGQGALGNAVLECSVGKIAVKTR